MSFIHTQGTPLDSEKAMALQILNMAKQITMATKFTKYKIAYREIFQQVPACRSL